MDLRAKTFYNTGHLRKEDFLNLYKVFNSQENLALLTPGQKLNLKLIVLYYLVDTVKDAKKIYINEYANNYQNLLNDSNIDKIHLLFNIIEMEIKIGFKDPESIKKLFNYYSKFFDTSKNYEEYLLYKFYVAYMKFQLKEYNSTLKYCNELILDMNDRKELIIVELLKYLQVRNILLKIKALEMDNHNKNRQEIISHLECLFDWIRGTREDLAISLGIKMHKIQAEDMDYEKCSKTLKEMVKVLKREALFGRSHKNIVDQYLYIYTLLGLYSTMLGKTDETKFYSKEIENFIEIYKKQNKINENNNHNNNNNFSSSDNDFNLLSEESNNNADDLIAKYEFFNVLLKCNLDFNINSRLEDSVKCISTYKQSINKTNKSTDVILNLFLLNPTDLLLSRIFQDLESSFIKDIENDSKIKDEDILIHYFYVYNQTAIISQTLVKGKYNDENKDKKLKDIKLAREYTKKIIDYTNKKIIGSVRLKNLFQLAFFKKLFNRLNFIHIYSYYMEQNYKKALEEFLHYDELIRVNYELDSEKETYCMIKKIKGDCFIQLGKYLEAQKIYLEIIGLGINNPVVFFNLGETYILLGKKFEAINAMEKALDLLKSKVDENKEMIGIITKILDELRKR